MAENNSATIAMKVLVILSVLCFVLAPVLLSCRDGSERIRIGSKNFSEQIILGELLAQQIESKTGLKVERRMGLGGTFICHQALTAGEIDAYVEYTGTAFTAIFKHNAIADPAEVYRRVKEEYADRHGIEVTAPLGFNNTFAIIIRGEEARRLKIKTISQAARYAPGWRAGFGYEFMERADGFPGLAQVYGLKFAEPPKVMDLTLTYRAVAEREVDLIAGNSTDGLIEKLDLVVLEDDRKYFPPYEAVPLARKQTLDRHPELRRALNQLGGLISEEEMRRLNYQVDGERRDVKQVVRDFLRSRGLS